MLTPAHRWPVGAQVPEGEVIEPPSPVPAPNAGVLGPRAVDPNTDEAVGGGFEHPVAHRSSAGPSAGLLAARRRLDVCFRVAEYLVRPPLGSLFQDALALGSPRTFTGDTRHRRALGPDRTGVPETRSHHTDGIGRTAV